jgi:hypothetical protein
MLVRAPGLGDAPAEERFPQPAGSEQVVIETIGAGLGEQEHDPDAAELVLQL